MRLAVIGAGAMGGLFAARMAPNVTDLHLIDANQELIRHVADEGLVVSGLTEARIRPASIPDPADGDYAVLVMVKNHHTASVVEQHRQFLAHARFVATLQNGWGAAETLAAAVPAERLVIGVTYDSSRVDGLGRLAHTGQGRTYVGPYQGRDGDTALAALFADLLVRSGFDAVMTPLVLEEIWRKLTLNAATLAPSALTGLRARGMPTSAPLMGLVDDLIEEIVAVAQGLGLAIDAQERRDLVHTILANAGDGKGSMMQDVEARRLTEVDAINGAVVRAADRQGRAAPLNRAMLALVHGLERSWSA